MLDEDMAQESANSQQTEPLERALLAIRGQYGTLTAIKKTGAWWLAYLKA